MNTRRKKEQQSLSALDQFNNFCKARAEQELFEAGAFPNARDVADVHEELIRLSRPSLSEEKQNPASPTKIIEASVTAPDGQTPGQEPGETGHQDRPKSPEQYNSLSGIRFDMFGLGVALDILFADYKPVPSGTSEEQQTPEKEPVKESPEKKE